MKLKKKEILIFVSFCFPHRQNSADLHSCWPDNSHFSADNSFPCRSALLQLQQVKQKLIFYFNPVCVFFFR